MTITQNIMIGIAGVLGLFLIIMGEQLNADQLILYGLVPLSLCFIGLAIIVRKQINEDSNITNTIDGDAKK